MLRMCDNMIVERRKRGTYMKPYTYYLIENGKILHYSYKFERVLNFTVEAKDAEIYYNGVLIWKQNV